MTRKWGRSRREHALTAVVEGFFGALWFSWQQTKPPAALNTVLVAGSVIALLAAAAGGVLSFRYRALPAAADDRSARRRYNIIAAAEFGGIGLGALLLAAVGHASYIPVWVCTVVGAHFFSLAPVLRDRSLYPLGALFCATAATALVVGLTTRFAPSMVTGFGAGWLLALFALFNLFTLPAAKNR
ncbi:MAG TPA: hypothetical protein VLF91_05510 [Candidatus Saccharimonadales bacterium]|nr:hypothetical protein [Candidatus Saccharimonadales bacterium]